ncbi:MAG: RraA family protein [Caldimonas sp.]
MTTPKTSPAIPKATEWPAGYRIDAAAPALPADLVTAFRAVPVAIAGDCLGRIIGAVGLRAYHEDHAAVLCGTAFTVRVRPGDNLMIHKALLMARAGDVIVIDGSGDLTQALIGGLMRTTAMARGVAGFVVDGAIRDVAEWADGAIPVFARGHTHRGPSKDGPGEINTPIACGGMIVLPGDLVLGDADGVIAIRADELAALLPKAQAQLARENETRQANADGAQSAERFDAILRAKGLPV